MRIEKNDCSHAFAVALLQKVGDLHGTDKKSGTYNRQDPTHFSKFKLVAWMDYGFGPSEEGGPPAPETVCVTLSDMTWGTTVRLTSSAFDIEGYWDSADGSWQWVKFYYGDGGYHNVPNSSPDFPAKVAEFHNAIVRVLLDGDWGNDKGPSDFVDPMDSDNSWDMVQRKIGERQEDAF